MLDKGKSRMKTIHDLALSLCILHGNGPYGTLPKRKNGEKNGIKRRKMQDSSYTDSESYTLSFTENCL